MDNSKKRTIACMTGTRADYPRVKSVLREIASRSNLTLKLIVTGMHLLKEFGYTVEEIERDGFDIAARVKMYYDEDSPYWMAKACARCADGIADALNKIQPDLFLITVDRVETLAAAQAAALMNIPIAHIQGGEVTGTIDESIRHAVTKLSHLHFTSSQDATDRIIKMGEDQEKVYTVGCPYLDIVNSLNYRDKEELAEDYEFDPEKQLIIFIQHPVTTEYGEGVEQVSISIGALSKFVDTEIIAIYSNADAGGREIINKMKKYPQFHVFPNIDFHDFLSLLKCADLIIGNSSTGIRESPSFQLPTVNIGTRQNGRLRASNVLDVLHNEDAIAQAIKTSLYDEGFKHSIKNVKNPYGDGHSAKRIVDILERVELSPELIKKRIRY